MSTPETLPMVPYKTIGGLAITDKDKKADPFTISAFSFIKKLRDARQFFAFDVGGSTRMYDARHLSAASGKFDQSCAEIRKDWDEFLARL